MQCNITKHMIFQVDNLVIKITFLTEQYCPLVFGGGKDRTDNIEIVFDFGDALSMK